MISGNVDVVVVGAGVIGLATAHEVARRGKSVLCFEQGTVGNGQSAGHTRTFRNLHESAEMTQRALQARGSWRTLEAQLGEKLVGSEGVLFYGGEIPGAGGWQNLKLAVRQLQPPEIESLLPLGRSDRAPDSGALLDVDGGAIRADRVCSRLARTLGERLKLGRVLGLRQHASEVEVQTSIGVWSCASAIVAAGVDTPALASAHGTKIPLRRSVHAQTTFEVKADIEPPCFLDLSGQFGQRAYGSVLAGGGEMAVGLDHRSEQLEVLAGDVLPQSTELRQVEERITAYAEAALPRLLGPPRSSRLCVFTLLDAGPDAFSAWQAGRITFVGGHNAFKFAPLIATELADVAEGGAVPDPLLPAPI